jgi:hypothetical protein
MKYAYGALEEWYCQGKTKVLGVKPIPVPLCSNTQLRMACDQPLASVETGRRLTSSASANDCSYNKATQRSPADVSPSAYFPVFPYSSTAIFFDRNAGTDKHMTAFRWDGEILSGRFVWVRKRHREGGQRTVNTSIHGTSFCGLGITTKSLPKQERQPKQELWFELHTGQKQYSLPLN